MNKTYLALTIAALLFCAGFGAGVLYRSETHTRWQIVRIEGQPVLFDRQNGDTFEVTPPLFTREQVRAAKGPVLVR